MALESTVICLDTSDWMINGDYQPSRMIAQMDAANLLVSVKFQGSPESTVGVLLHGGVRVKMLSPPCDDEGKVLASLHGVKCGGPTNLVHGIKMAMLALKHRRNKNGGQRIVAFLGSPVSEADRVLKKLGNQLRKNNIALDLILIGENEANDAKVQTLVSAANSNDNSHIVGVPAGLLPSDVLLNSVIVTGISGGSSAGGAAGSAGASAGNAFAQYGGINPELDPELAMTMAASLEEMKQKTEQNDAAAAAAAAASGDKEATPAAAAAAPAPAAAAAAAGGDAAAPSTPAAAGAAATPQAPAAAARPAAPARSQFEEDEDADLMRALAMSMQQFAPPAAASPAPAPAPAPASATAEPAAAAAAAAPAAAGAGDEDVEDLDLEELLQGIPGVDLDDPDIAAALHGDKAKDDSDAEDKEHTDAK